MSATYGVQNVRPVGQALRPLTSPHARPPQPPGPLATSWRPAHPQACAPSSSLGRGVGRTQR